MDWHLAIDKHREALKGILAMLVAMVAVNRDNVPPNKALPLPTLPRHLHRRVLRLLRPAEAATRRLIIVAARGMVVDLAPLRRPKPKPQSIYVRDGVGTGIVRAAGWKADTVGIGVARSDTSEPVASQSFDATTPVPSPFPNSPTLRRLSLPLFDPLKRFGARRRYVASTAAPRIRSFDDPRVPLFQPPPAPDPLPLTPYDLINAGRIHRRIEAIASALDDLPRQAKRLARWQARRDARLIQEGADAETANLPPRGGDVRPFDGAQDRGGQRRAPQVQTDELPPKGPAPPPLLPNAPRPASRMAPPPRSSRARSPDRPPRSRRLGNRTTGHVLIAAQKALAPKCRRQLA